MIPRPLLEIEPLEKTTLVRFNREVLDWETAKIVGEELAGVVSKSGAHTLRLNLAPVRVLTAAMLGRFIKLHRAMLGQGGKLEVRNVGAPIFEVFRVTRLTELLDVRPALANIRIAEEPGPAGAKVVLAHEGYRTTGIRDGQDTIDSVRRS